MEVVSNKVLLLFQSPKYVLLTCSTRVFKILEQLPLLLEEISKQKLFTFYYLDFEHWELSGDKFASLTL